MSIGIIAASPSTVGADAAAVWAFNDVSHDEGLQHPHHWARESSAGRLPGPIAANTAAWPTPSSTVHDDVHYGIA